MLRTAGSPPPPDSTQVRGRERSILVCFGWGSGGGWGGSEDEQRVSRSSVRQHSKLFHIWTYFWVAFCLQKKKIPQSIHPWWCRAAARISRKGQLWTRRPEAKQNKQWVKYSGGRKAGEHKEPGACRRYKGRVILQQEKQLPV